LAEPVNIAVFSDQRASALQPAKNDLSIANTRLRYVSGALRGEVVEDPGRGKGRIRSKKNLVFVK